MSDISVAVEQLKLIMKDTSVALADDGGFVATDIEDWEDIYDGLLMAVSVVKDVTGEFSHLTESEQKAAVSDALNELINIPWVPEGLEGKMISIAVGMAWKAWEDKFESN